MSPQPEPAPEPATAGALRNAPPLRRIAVLVAGSAIFIGPMTSMAVPIAAQLRPPDPSEIAAGSGLLMAAFGIGRLLAPLIVRRLSKHHEIVAASAFTALGAGILLVLFAAASMVRGQAWELTDWLVLGTAFGVLLYGGKSLSVGAADRQGEDKALNQTIVVLVAALAGPVGAFAWGWSIDNLGAERALLLAGIAIAMVSIALGGHRLIVERGVRPAEAESA